MEREGLYSAKTVAKWFLYYNQAAIDSEDADLISNLKLQKLLYYAQGCYLAIKGKPLFFEKILAWAHGPVVNEVYQEYKHYHSNGIIYNGDYDNSIKNRMKNFWNKFMKYLDNILLGDLETKLIERLLGVIQK